MHMLHGSSRGRTAVPTPGLNKNFLPHWGGARGDPRLHHISSPHWSKFKPLKTHEITQQFNQSNSATLEDVIHRRMDFDQTLTLPSQHATSIVWTTDWAPCHHFFACLCKRKKPNFESIRSPFFAKRSAMDSERLAIRGRSIFLEFQ